MKKIAILTDSTSSLNDIKVDYDIHILPLGVVFTENETYIDGVTITANQFYEKLQENPELIPRTSQITFAQALDKYEELIEQGYTDIIVVTISKELSGTYQSFLTAAEEVNDQVNIFLFDSQHAAIGEGLVVLEAARLVQEGVQPEEVIKQLTVFKSTIRTILVVDTLKYLVKNGRLSGASGFLGSMLKIKPLLEVSSEGKIETLEKIRTKSKALIALMDKFKEETNGNAPKEVFVLHSLADKDANDIIAQILDLYPGVGEIQMIPVSPVIGAHVGLGVVGVVFRK